MAQLWKVYRENEILGPMSAAELRQALREGIVEPFDLVGKEGSKLRLELIEADEVFDVSDGESAVATTKTFQVKAKAQGPGGDGAFQSKERTKFNEFYDKLRSRVTGNPRKVNDTQVSSPDTYSAPGRKNLQKVYYAMDSKGRSMGPLAASEVVGLFQRGILGRDVRIHKGNGTKRISVGRFVALYAGQRLQDLAMLPGKNVPRSHPNSTVINEMARGNAIRQQASQDVYMHPVVLIAIGLIIGIVVFFVVESGLIKKKKPKDLRNNRQTTAVSHEDEVRLDPSKGDRPAPAKPKLTKTKIKMEAVKGHGKPRALVGAPVVPAPVVPAPLEEVTPEETPEDASNGAQGPARPNKAKPAKAAKPTATRAKNVTSSVRPPPEPAPVVAPIPTPLAKTPAAVKPRAANPPVANPPVANPPVSKKPAKAAKATPKVAEEDISPMVTEPAPDVKPAKPKAPAKAAKPVKAAAESGGGGSGESGGLSDLPEKVGQTVTLGPLAFSKASVGKCTLKCKIPFTDGKGRTITGVFFKDAPFGDKLRSASGHVMITGLVKQDGGGFSIFLSDVK